MNSKRTERALEHVLREVRADSPPYVDFDALETRLPKGAVPAAPPERSRGPLLLAAALVALVAGASGLSVWRTEPVAPPVVQSTTRASSGPTNGDSLAPGSAVRTLAERRTVEHPLRATWTLGPNSQATLVSSGDVILVRLERGSITAQIVPSTRPETFAVEAADVRVAAHGTVFRVTLGDSGVGVEVEEGAVLVGPRATPGVGKLLASPASERFTLLGEPEQKLRAERQHRPAREAHPSADPPSTPVPENPGPAQPAPEAVEQALGSVFDLASGCFRQRTSASDGVRVTAHTLLHFESTPAGGIGSVRFDPPLAPNVQACIDEGIAKIRVAPTARGFQGSRTVDLER